MAQTLTKVTAKSQTQDIRICLLLYYLREIFGAERVALHLAEGFVAKGYQVDLVTIQPGIAEDTLPKIPPGVRIIDLGIADLGGTPTWKKLFALADYLRKERPTALISFCDTINLATWAKLWAGVPTRVIVGIHNALSSDGTDTMKGIKGKFRAMLMRLSYPWAQGVAAVSQGLAEDLSNFSGLPLSKIQVVYNPVVTPSVLEKAQAPVEHPWFVAGEPPVILGVGRLHEQKGFATLIQAFALVRKQKTSRLMILGEGHLRPQLEALVNELGLQDDVALPGYVGNPYAYMAKAAVFTLSSGWEGLPTVLIEAIAVGTPVVSTDCQSGPSEILQNGTFGNLVPVGDVEALATAIVATLDAPDQKTRQEVLKRRGADFSLENSINKYLEVMGIQPVIPE